MRIIYLHGFASGPSSGKARFFQRKFSERGITLEIPDLAAGDFENLTITGQLQVIERQARSAPVVLIGSSMGGYLAALYASSHPEVQRLLLLAPAFYFPQRWPEELGATICTEWQRTGYMEIYHYVDNCRRRLSYGLLEDAQRYPPDPSFHQPALLFHGRKDDVVPVAYSEEFAAKHANVKLRVVESDHQLTDAVERIWTESEPFLLG